MRVLPAGACLPQWQVMQLEALEEHRRRNAEKMPAQFQAINDRIQQEIKTSYNDAQTAQAGHAPGEPPHRINNLRGTDFDFGKSRTELPAAAWPPPGGDTHTNFLQLSDVKPASQLVSDAGFDVLDQKSLCAYCLRVQPAAQTIQGEFFKVNDRKLDALINATTNDMQRAEYAVLRMTNDQYRSIIFNAQVYANTGAGTYAKAVDMATRDFLSAGINCIEYQNGRRVNISAYAEMALRTASKRAYLQGEGEMRQKWGIHTVIMNKRTNACPKCAPFAGRVIVDDVWSGGQACACRQYAHVVCR